MAKRQSSETPAVFLSCGMGVVAALLHWIVPTRLLLGSNPPEYAVAAVAAALSLGALALLVFGFLVPQIRAKQGLSGHLPFLMPALVWSVFGLFVGACATVVKLMQAISYGFVPVQTEGADWSFSVLTLINVPVLCCFLVLYLLDQKQPND